MFTDVLVEKEVISPEQLEAGRRRRELVGGSLTENLIELGFLTERELEDIARVPPIVPRTPKATGLPQQFLLDFLIKCMYISGIQTIPEMTGMTMLSGSVVENLLQVLRKKRLVETLGSVSEDSLMLRYALSEAGRRRAIEALRQSEYIGPAPVTLRDYQEQVEKQSILFERITTETLRKVLSHLVLEEDFIDELGPAMISGKAILIHGPSGNGKSSVARSLGDAFEQKIFVPHCIYFDGQVIKIFDPSVHTEVGEGTEAEATDAIRFQQSDFDPRWVRCRRPVVLAGGELNLNMLDLEYNRTGKFYEAPLQLKANGGIFIIDDFGRQLMSVSNLINRWIVPLERGVDYLSLHTGKKFEVPFDEIIFFSSNSRLEDLLDEALFRRLPYKIYTPPPTEEAFREIFRRVCDLYDLELSDEIMEFTLKQYRQKDHPRIACFHPALIVQHALSVCRFEGTEPRLTPDLVQEALRHLAVSGQESSVSW